MNDMFSSRKGTFININGQRTPMKINDFNMKHMKIKNAYMLFYERVVKYEVEKSSKDTPENEGKQVVPQTSRLQK